MGHAESLEPLLLTVAARCLQLAPEAIDPTAPLARYGLDSLNAVEFAVALSEVSGVEIGEDELLEAFSLSELAQLLVARTTRSRRQQRLLARLRRDACLPAQIDPLQVAPFDEGAILLTGATGFLGAHLLQQLLAASGRPIICPVRAQDDAHAMERIRATLSRYAVAIAGAERRIEARAAQLSRRRFGLDRGGYADLARRVGTVYHCAADVNWALGYAGLRTANVVATRELLHFACTGVRKSFHFISSVAACYSTRPGAIPDETGAAVDVRGIHSGYGQSKWVAERLVEACRRRGLRATLYRPSLILGDSASGCGNDDDMVARLIRAVIALGWAPEFDWRIDACPVDFVARAIVAAASCGQQPLPAVHLRNPYPAHWNEAVLWMNLQGYQVRLEPMKAWLARAERHSRSVSHPLYPLRRFLFVRGKDQGARTLAEIHADPAVANLEARRTNRLLDRLGMPCPRIGGSLLARYFARWVDRRLLPQATKPTVAPGNAASEGVTQAIQRALRKYDAAPDLVVTHSHRHEFGAEQSILGELVAWRAGGEAGMQLHRLGLTGTNALPDSLELVVKPKFPDTVLRDVSVAIARLSSDELAAQFTCHADAIGLSGGSRREVMLYAGAVHPLSEYTPAFFGVIEERGVYRLLLERVHDCDGVDGTTLEPRRRAEIALQGIGSIHGAWLQQGGSGAALFDGAIRDRLDAAIRAEPLWLALASHARPLLQQWVGAQASALHWDLARASHGWLHAMRDHPRTLIHNDFSPRNFVLRAHRPGPRLCAFDWELAEYGLPQRDLVELLCFSLSLDAPAAEIEHLLEHHRASVERCARSTLDPKQWHRGVRLALADFAVRRLPLLVLAQRFRTQPYLQRVVRTWWRLTQLLGEPLA